MTVCFKIYILIYNQVVFIKDVLHQNDLSEVGFEPTPPFGDQKPHWYGRYNLESGALDHSAILTTENKRLK